MNVLTVEAGGLQAIEPAGGRTQGTTADPTTTSATYVVVPEMTATLTFKGGRVLVFFNGDFNVRSNDDFNLSVFLDAAQDIPSERRCAFFGGSLLGLTPAAVTSFPGALVALLTPAAGSHTIDVRWKVAAGTARALGTRRSLVIAEVF